MKELKNGFEALSRTEKIELLKEIMPAFCQMFNEDPQGIMKEMMPYCKEMMQDCNMDMSTMMSMVNKIK